MTITFKTKASKVKKLQVWHKKFIIFPRKTAENQIQFLTYVGRKLPDDYTPSILKSLQYKYKDLQQVITDKLMDKEN